MAEIDHIPGEHIPQGVIPQKRVGQYSFLIRSYAIYKGQGKTLDGAACRHCLRRNTDAFSGQAAVAAGAAFRQRAAAVQCIDRIFPFYPAGVSDGIHSVFAAHRQLGGG